MMQLTRSLQSKVDEALEQIVREQLEVVVVRGTSGMKLVRDGTAAAEERRQRPGCCITVISVTDGTFILCHS